MKNEELLNYETRKIRESEEHTTRLLALFVLALLFSVSRCPEVSGFPTLLWLIDS